MRLRSRGNADVLNAEHAEAGIEITASSGVTLWRGEQMDDQLAVEALFRRDRR